MYSIFSGPGRTPRVMRPPTDPPAPRPPQQRPLSLSLLSAAVARPSLQPPAPRAASIRSTAPLPSLQTSAPRAASIRSTAPLPSLQPPAPRAASVRAPAPLPPSHASEEKSNAEDEEVEERETSPPASARSRKSRYRNISCKRPPCRIRNIR